MIKCIRWAAGDVRPNPILLLNYVQLSHRTCPNSPQVCTCVLSCMDLANGGNSLLPMFTSILCCYIHECAKKRRRRIIGT